MIWPRCPPRSGSATQPRCSTPCMVWLAISSAHSSSVRYSDVNRRPPESAPGAPSRRSCGRRSRSDGTREPRPVCGRSRPNSAPSFQRSANSARTAAELRAASSEAVSRTSRSKSSSAPGVGSAQTSSIRKSGVSSWIRQGREVCAVLGSRMCAPSIQLCMDGPYWIDARPDPHSAQQLDRRRPESPRRRRPGRRTDRLARQGARGHPRRLLLALRRPPRAAGRDARHLGAPEPRRGPRTRRARGRRHRRPRCARREC